MQKNGNLGNSDVTEPYYALRPVVSLKAGSVILSGEGTLEKPYIIE